MKRAAHPRTEGRHLLLALASFGLSLVGVAAVVGTGAGALAGCASTNAQAEIAGIAPEPLFGGDDDATRDDADESGGDERATDPAADPANVWIEQPTIGDIGVDWPPKQTVLELELDPAIATSAAMVTLRVDDMALWHGPWSETVHVALPEGAHQVSVAMVAPDVIGQRAARVETRVKCRQRVTAWSDHGHLRLQHEDECAASAPAHSIAAAR